MAGTSIVEQWVERSAELTRPADVVWCDGSKAEYDRLVEDMVRDRSLLPLNPRTDSNCYLHRSHPPAVTATQHPTYICRRDTDHAGPTNNSMAPAEAEPKAGATFLNAMRGRTRYVIPYLMGPAGSTASRAGVML